MDLTYTIIRWPCVDERVKHDVLYKVSLYFILVTKGKWNAACKSMPKMVMSRFLSIDRYNRNVFKIVSVTEHGVNITSVINMNVPSGKVITLR